MNVRDAFFLVNFYDTIILGGTAFFKARLEAANPSMIHDVHTPTFFWVFGIVMLLVTLWVWFMAIVEIRYMGSIKMWLHVQSGYSSPLTGGDQTTKPTIGPIEAWRRMNRGEDL